MAAKGRSATTAPAAGAGSSNDTDVDHIDGKKGGKGGGKHKGKGGKEHKGKGKVKGDGKQKGAKKGGVHLEGRCDKCSKWGHKAKQCWHGRTSLPSCLRRAIS